LSLLLESLHLRIQKRLKVFEMFSACVFEIKMTQALEAPPSIQSSSTFTFKGTDKNGAFLLTLKKLAI